ncbi:hypothetical protein ACM26M_02840 [Kluyvera cryocrescens]|uniref:hypothetical protein n=1 Tax=Kluyvera cryocrescens TaxID=580 RepID=UPI0039F6DC62
MKYFDIDATVMQLIDGRTTRNTINSCRRTCERGGYTERYEFFNEVLRRYDAYREEMKAKIKEEAKK